MVLFLQMLDATPATSSLIRQWTSRDPILSKIINMVYHGHDIDGTNLDFKPYQVRQTELSIEEGILLWGSRVVIPPQGRDVLLQELHEGHPGVVRMKALARGLLWWPKLDNDIEQYVKHCDPCQRTRYMPSLAPLHPWEFTKRPWSRLHVDYAGPVNGNMLFIIVDSHNKWIDAHVTSGCTSIITINKLHQSLSTYGIPDTIVSHNATWFMSSEFQEFCKHSVIRHITSAPHHPSSNGLAERAVLTFMSGLKRMGNGNIEHKLLRFLFAYRRTPHSTTNLSSSEPLMNRKLKSRLDQIRPDINTTLTNKQQNQKDHHDLHMSHRTFVIGQQVYTLICRDLASVIT